MLKPPPTINSKISRIFKPLSTTKNFTNLNAGGNKWKRLLL